MGRPFENRGDYVGMVAGLDDAQIILPDHWSDSVLVSHKPSTTISGRDRTPIEDMLAGQYCYDSLATGTPHKLSVLVKPLALVTSGVMQIREKTNLGDDERQRVAGGIESMVAQAAGVHLAPQLTRSEVSAMGDNRFDEVSSYIRETADRHSVNQLTALFGASAQIALGDTKIPTVGMGQNG